MRVIMNGLSALKPRTGVGHYVARLHGAMSASVDLYPGERASRFTRWVQNSFPSTLPQRAKVGGRAGVTKCQDLIKHLGKTAIGIHFALACRAAGYDLYHEPNFIPFSTSVPTVITVHDLSVLLHPEWHPVDRVRHHERHFLPAVRRAQKIITVSHQVRHELITELGIQPDKVVAVHNGVGHEFAPLPACAIESVRARLGLPPRYMLSVGTIEPRKNLLTVLRAFLDLPGRIRKLCPLVLAGPWGWKSEPERTLLAAQNDDVIILGYTNAKDLPALYGGAEALLYPSFYEGFGLPPVEALACGTQVLAARNCVAVREVLGPHGLFLEANDLAAWRTELKRIATSHSHNLQPSRAAILHARSFTWQKTAEQTLNVYRTIFEPTRVASPLRSAA